MSDLSHRSLLSAALLTRARFTTATTQTLLVLGGVAFLSVMAQIAIPVPGSPVPVTGQTLGVLLLATSYGATLGLGTFVLYLVIGIAGAPIFAGGHHGLERLIGPTGGYLIGMLVASLVLGALAGARWDQRFRTAIPTMVIGTIIVFTFGLIWLQHYTDKDWSWTFANGFRPFIFGELLKIAIASTLMPTLWRIVPKK